MTGKPEDSLYPEPEEQKIEINPLSYLNTPDTATEAEFAVAVDELAKLSPFNIRETGDYSQFGADNAKDAFFNLRKATIHGIESLSDDESRAWFDTDPEDIETRYRIASENLPPSQKMSLAAGTAMASGRPDVPSGKEYEAAPDEIKAAADRLRESTPVVELAAGEFYGAVGDFDITNIPPERQQDYQSILQWRDRQEKERTISAYDARINAKNTLRKWAMMRPLLSDDMDGLLQHIMADKPRDDEFDAKFMALPEDKQEVVMMLGRDLRNTPDKNMLRDLVREFLNGGKRLFVNAGREARDIWMLGETDREDFQKQAEIKARLEELWAPKRSQEYGYWEDAILGVVGSLPYTGFTMATAMAGVPEVGLGVISLSMAHQFKQQIALQGGDVTDPKVLVLAQAAGIAYWGIEQAQVGTWMKSMTDLERRMATATFAKNIIPSIYKAEARAKVRQVAPKLLRDNTADLLKEWLFEEENQDLLEEGFVSWGIGEDVARNMAEQAVESLQQNFGTMLLMTGGFSGIGAARTGLSRKYTDQELYDAMHHRAQLVGSLHQRTELREKLRKGEEIDPREMKRLERDIDYQRRVLSTMHRAFNKAGGMEDAESAFQRMGLDPRQSFLAAYMFDQERRAIMGDPELSQAEKEELLGKQATSLSLLKQAYQNRTFTENPDGTFTSSYTLNGAEVRQIHQTGTIEWDPASPEGATSAVNAINAAEKAARLSGAPFSDNMKGMTVERWLNITPEARNEIVQALDLHPEGNFIFTAKMAGSPDVAQVDEKQIRHLSGEITLAPDADQTAAFHEDLHAFVRYLRETGELTPQDIQKLREEFGDPRKGVNEDFNEENAAETIRKMQSRSVRHVESTGAEAIMDKVFDTLDRIDLFRRKKKQAETVAENLMAQMRRGEWTGIPAGTITEAQRQKNAQLRKKARSKPKKHAKKPQEPTANEPEQSQEPPEAEIQPEGQAGEKPPSQTPTAAQGEGQTAEEAAAAAEADEIGAGETAEVDADQPLGKGEWRAVTPKGNVYVRGEWVVVDMDDLKTSDQAGYDQSIQPRDRGTVRSRAQIHEIARRLNPQQLLDSARTDDGSPVMMPDGSVLSGNGRVMALREARDIGNIAKYEAVVRRRAAELGIAIPAEIKNPVLVRRMDSIEGPSTVQQVAELSNQPVILQRSEAEIAESDARAILDNGLLRLFTPGADGNVLSASNMDFINGLVQATGDASLVDSNNRPTEATRNRIRRALLAMLVGEGDNARDIVRGLVEDAKNLGMKTEVDGLLKAAADIVTVARDKPQYSLLNDIGLALRMYMDMKREGSSPFQADLFGRPEAVDLIVKALWSRSSAGAIADIFSDYATRARLVDTSTAGLGLDKDPTKEELLKAAIDATGTGETAEQAQQKKAEEAAAESPEAPPPPTQKQRAIEKKGAAPTATGQELRDAIAAQATPEPAKYDPEPNAPPTTGDMKEALPNMDELRFWRETPTLPMSRNPDVLGAAKILPYMLAGNKSHIYAHHHDMFEAVVQGAPAFVDCFGGAATYLYNLANAGVLPDNSTWNEWEYTRYVTTKQIKENPEGVIAALDALSDRLEQAIPPGSRAGAEIDATRDAIIDWLNAELRGEHGIAYVPAENAEDAEGRTILLDTPESAALYLLVQNISYSARAQDVSMYEGKPTWTTAGDDAKLHPTDGKLLTLVDAKGKWGVSFRLAYPSDIIRKASKLMVEKNVNVTQRDGWTLAGDLDVAPDGAVVTIDTSYFGAQNYGLKTREDGDMDTWLAKVRKHLLPHVDRLTFIITNNWNFHAVNELQKMGFLVARTERAGESPELVAMSGRARHIIAPAIRTVDYLGQRIEQAGGDRARLSASITPWTPEEGGRLYHGTAARDFGQFDGDIVYLAADPSETEPFAGMAEGSNRNVSTSRRPRVIAVNAAPGKIKNIDEAVADALMDDLDVEKHILAEANTARDEGFRYVSFSHPGIRSEREFDAIVSLYPKQDLKIDKERDIDGIQRDEQGDLARFSVSAGNIRSIQRFYHAFSRGTTPDIADAFDAATTLRNYFAEYLRWYREVWDKTHRGYGTNGNDVDENNRVRVAYSQRLSELDKAIESSDLKKLIVAVDNGVNQWHLDYPVIAHLRMEYEAHDDVPQEMEPIFDDIVNMLRSLGRLPEQSPYRYSISAKASKALESGVYKDDAKETIAALNRIPATLRPYVGKYDDPDDLISLAQFAGWKTGPKVAPEHRAPYRPAVRLADGSIAWHPRARMHSEALAMWLKQQDIPLDAFDIDEYYGDGGLGPDGRYYEKAYIGDGVYDFVEGRETGRFSVQARQPAPAFYSQLRRVIEQKVPNRATVAQVRATIDPAKGSGVKADEVFWSGLQEFLDGKKPTDMVTKEEVLAATREVVVTDVVKDDFPDYEVKELADKLFQDAVNEKYEDWVDRYGDPFGPEYTAEERKNEDGETYFAVVTGSRGMTEEVDSFDNEAEAIDEAERLTNEAMANAEEETRRNIASDMDYSEYVEDARRELADESGTKFASYQLPGGENYRELLLTLPPTDTTKVVYNEQSGVYSLYSSKGQLITSTIYKDRIEREKEFWNANAESFKSGHFSEPNIVAHVRFNERTSADGKRTLFIEEIQSDWAQKGREEGFGGEWRVEDIDAHPNDRNIATFKSQEAAEAAAENYREADDSGHRIVVIEESAGVPSAPYVTKTDAWVSLALKRMVRLAAENGFEQVAWTTGEQQAERYDLSKQVDSIKWAKMQTSDAGEQVSIKAIKNGQQVITEMVSPDKVADYIGKELAKQIVESSDRTGEIKGDNLKVGGEGMKGFYDQIVPTTANKLFKRFGARVGEAWFDLGDPEDAVAPPPDDMVDEGGFTAHALPITPAMRDSVLYEGQARFSVKAYPNLYRDVLSKHPASDKLDGNKAWLTLDGKWINVDDHRDAVPFDDGIYADIGVQEMAEAGLVRVHWVDFSSMPGGVMYAEHAPGQLTRAQRKELEDTAIERGGEVEYDPGQAWIRQPPPRYSVRARAPLFGNNNRAIASLAVQHLMGEKLDTERAEKAMYLFAASGTTPDQMIADAKKLAESKVAQEAKKHIENRDPNAAHQVMSQQAEYDSIVALRTGMKSGLKMGQEAERAKQAAEKKLLLNARGEDLQQFIIDTGIDWTETLLSSLPEAFAEWEKARKDAEEKAKKEGAPEGPQQEPEAPPADPAELEARDRRMRELVAATRAWGDAERAKREKEADDRRKKEQERIEKGESGEEADDTDADQGGEQAEGMEPEGLVTPKELLQAHGVDIRNAQEVAHLIRIWMAGWLVRQSKGRLTHQTVWKDREAVEKYRKTMVAQLRDMANGMVEQGWSMTVIHNRISDIPSTARPDTIERRTASIIAMIQAHSIRQTRAQLIADIRKNIKKKAIKGKRHDALNEDLERKINSEQELTARYLRRILTWSPEKVDAEIVAIQARLKERTELYSEQNPDAKVPLDVEFHRDLMRLLVLQEWGGLNRMLPAQIKQAGIAIHGWLVSAQERLYRRWWALQEQIGKLVTALHDAIVPDDPEQARIEVGKVSQWISDNVATVRQRLEGLIRQQHDPVKRQAAQAAIDEIMFILSRGTEVYRTVAHEYRQAFVDAVNEIAGGKRAATAYMKHLEEEIPIEVAEQVSRQGYDGRGGGRVMTYNQALQLYASITQRGYASNVKLHNREEHAALLESIFTTEDLALIARLREIYEERRGRLSEVVQEVSGMLVWRPDPLYMPVRVKMPKKGGFQSKGDPSTWMPLARSLTPRVHHGLDFDEGATLTGTFYDATEDAARAIGFGTRGLVLRGVLGNSAVQEAADRYYGGKEMADLNQQVVQALDGFGRTDQDSTHGMLRTIRELNAYVALSWNPLTALKQAVSFPVFAMALDGGFGQVLSAIKDFDREALREIMESDGFKARYQGGFMPEVAEILADGRSNIIARFYKLGMTTVQIGDFVPSLLVAPGLYKARLAQNLADGMDEATAKERAMTWTWEMIEATQQTSRAEMLPKFYRQTGAGSEAMKLILQFSSAPLLQLSHEYHAWRDAMAGVDGAWKRLGRAVLVNHIIIPQMMEMVKKMFYWLIGRDEPEDQQLFWTIFNGATIGAIDRIMIIGILAETAYNAVVNGKISYGGQMVPAESLTRTAAYAVRAFLHDPFDPEDGMDAFQSDIVKALEGMLAPFRYGKEFYDNRIAQ